MRFWLPGHTPTESGQDPTEQRKRASSQKRNMAMEGMTKAISEIKRLSDETDRAGEAGKGFAVVAEEVRNLAQRSAEAAKNMSALIAQSQSNSDNGVKATGELVVILKDITAVSDKVLNLMKEISAASDEQSRGIEQINVATTQVSQATQQAAANAEESSSASQELAAQSQEIQAIVVQLNSVANGANAASTNGASTGRRPGSLAHGKPHQGALGEKHHNLTLKARPTMGKSALARVAAKTVHKEPTAEELIPLEAEKHVAEFH